MSRFTGPLRIEEVEPGKCWRLLDAIHYEAREKGSGIWIIVPAGFETDGATIPRFIRVFLAVWGSYGRAAALHDHCYERLRMATPHYAVRTRRLADAEFYKAMLACGTSKPLAWLMWLAVRIGGAGAAGTDF